MDCMMVLRSASACFFIAFTEMSNTATDHNAHTTLEINAGYSITKTKGIRSEHAAIHGTLFQDFMASPRSTKLGWSTPTVTKYNMSFLPVHYRITVEYKKPPAKMPKAP